MLRNRKLLGIVLVAGAVLFTGCSKTIENSKATPQNEAEVVQTDNSEEADEFAELEKPAEEDRITVELALTRNNIYNACLAPTLNRKTKDTNMEKYNIHQFEAYDEAVKALKDGTVDMAIIEVDEAAKLYNENKDIKVISTNTLSNLYVTSLVDEVDEVSGDLSSLKGKTVYVAKDNSSAQTMIELALKNADCTIEYVESNDKIVAMIEQSKGEYFAAPEPYHTTARLKNSNLSLIADLGQAIEMAYPTSCVVANADFIKENEGAIPYILDDHLKSIKTTVHAPTRTAQWAKDNNMSDDPSLLLSSMQNFHFTYYDGQAMADVMNNYYTEMAKLNENAVPKVPDTDMYYINN